ncbi:hypothetical protein CFC21_018484, partial [Triticum aestivum]
PVPGVQEGVPIVPGAGRAPRE